MIAALGAALIAVSVAGLFLFYRLHRLTHRHVHDFYAVAVDYNSPARLTPQALAGDPGTTGILFRCARCHEVTAAQLAGCWTLTDVRAGDAWLGDRRYTEVEPGEEPDAADAEADEFIGEIHDASRDGDTDWRTRPVGYPPPALPAPRAEDADTSANLPAVPRG